MKRLLFSRLDNSPLILFRISFGILIALECFGALFTGWVKRNFILPELTFPFIGFEWLQPLPGIGMYFYFGLMGALGISIALGYRYRWSILLFSVLWTAAYLMQKTAYNNHYYLIILLSGIMCFLPANRAISLDVKRKSTLEQDSMFSWVKWIIVAQLWVYIPLPPLPSSIRTGGIWVSYPSSWLQNLSIPLLEASFNKYGCKRGWSGLASVTTSW